MLQMSNVPATRKQRVNFPRSHRMTGCRSLQWLIPETTSMSQTLKPRHVTPWYRPFSFRHHPKLYQQPQRYRYTRSEKFCQIPTLCDFIFLSYKFPRGTQTDVNVSHGLWQPRKITDDWQRSEKKNMPIYLCIHAMFFSGREKRPCTLEHTVIHRCRLCRTSYK